MKCSLNLLCLLFAVASIFAFAYRICHPSGRWFKNWTNYTECLNILVSTESDYEHNAANNQSAAIRRIVICIIFFCSIVSLLLLLVTLLIFCYFKTLSSCRIRVHRNLVLALIIHSALLVILSLPHLFGGSGPPPPSSSSFSGSFPDSSLSSSSSISISSSSSSFSLFNVSTTAVEKGAAPFSNLSTTFNSTVFSTVSSPSVFDDWHINDYLCKTILTMKLYSTLAVINWMFIEGLLLHSRITVSVFRKDAPFKMYYAIGWGLPLLLVLLWATQMSLEEPTSHCWTGYGDSFYIWIIVGPMIVALLINCIFLVNIIRVLLTKLRLTVTIELTQIRKAIKATALLFPLLGISHLLFAINPDDDGQLEDAYMIVNAFFQSSQGIFVAILYCFMDSEVQTVLRSSYERHVRYHRSTTTSSSSQRRFPNKLRFGNFNGWSRNTSTNRSNLSNTSVTVFPAKDKKSPIHNGTGNTSTSILNSFPAAAPTVLELAVNGGSYSNGAHPQHHQNHQNHFNHPQNESLPTASFQNLSHFQLKCRPDPNHLQPPTPPKKSRSFQFRQPNGGKSPLSPLSPTNLPNSISTNSTSKPRTCIVYNSTSGTMVRFGNNGRSSSQTYESQQKLKPQKPKKKKRSSSTPSRKSSSSTTTFTSSPSPPPPPPPAPLAAPEKFNHNCGISEIVVQ